MSEVWQRKVGGPMVLVHWSARGAWLAAGKKRAPPMMVEATNQRELHQPRASCAGVRPCFLATSTYCGGCRVGCRFGGCVKKMGCRAQSLDTGKRSQLLAVVYACGSSLCCLTPRQKYTHLGHRLLGQALVVPRHVACRAPPRPHDVESKMRKQQRRQGAVGWQTLSALLTSKATSATRQPHLGTGSGAPSPRPCLPACTCLHAPHRRGVQLNQCDGGATQRWSPHKNLQLRRIAAWPAARSNSTAPVSAPPASGL